MKILNKRIPVEFEGIVYKMYEPAHYREGDLLIDRRDLTVWHYLAVDTENIIAATIDSRRLIPITATYRLEPVYSFN